MDLHLGEGDFLLGQTRRFLPSHALAALILNFEELVDLLQGQTSRLDVEVPDEGHPNDVQHSENDVEFPAEVDNAYGVLVDTPCYYTKCFVS